VSGRAGRARGPASDRGHSCGQLVLAAAASIAIGLACTETPLSIPGDSAPGASVETVEFTLLSSDLPLWRDTTLSGFAIPFSASFSLVSNRPELLARTFAKLNVPDTITTFADTLPVDVFSDVRVRIQVDTIRSVFSTFPVTLRLIELTTPFDVFEVAWQQAEDGVPWTPGGDLGVELAAGELEASTDTASLSLSVEADSLLKAWQQSDGENGFALVVEGPETELHVAQILWRYDALLQGRTEPAVQSQVAGFRTFASEPAVPAHGSDLRVGGLPASRFYIEFSIPASISGIPLEGSTINHAEVVFTPLPPPAGPFALRNALVGRQVNLLADPFVFGAKTPIGADPLNTTLLDPDSLAVSSPLRLDVSLLLQRASADPGRRIRIGLRADPDAQVLQFWEFGSTESPPALQPRLRIIMTPRLDVEVPE